MNISQSAHRLRIAVMLHYAVQLLSYVAVAIISVYRVILSPLLLSISGPACRFEPTCSAYAIEAISRYGIAHGGWVALKRLLKCRPFGVWGFDPVPGGVLRKHPDDRRPAAITRNYVG
jgi:uncharacterized protein